MKVLTLLNEKGGVCKSTMAIHIAAGLASRGSRVVLIDSDPQGMLGYYFGMVPPDHYYHLLAQGLAWDAAWIEITPETYEDPRQPSGGRLLLVPGNRMSRNIAEDVTDSATLYRRLQELEGVADIVIIDTAPTPSLAMSLIYIATDGVLYPTELSRPSLQSLLNSLASRAGMIDMQQREIKLMGIIPTKTRLQTIEHQENLKMLAAEYGSQVWEGTSLSIVWEEAAGQSRTIFAYAPASRGAAEMWQIVERVETELEAITDGTK